MKRFCFTKPLIALFLVLTALTVGSLQAFAVEAEAVTVTGHGEVIAPADHAEISFSLEGRGISKEDAAKNAEKMESLVEKAVSSYGSLRMESYYTYKDCATGNFCVSSCYTLVTEKMGEVGGITEKLIASGVSFVNPVFYLLRNREEWEKQALTAAIADAEARAKVCGAGARLSELHDLGSEPFCCYGRQDGTVSVTCTVTMTYEN